MVTPRLPVAFLFSQTASSEISGACSSLCVLIAACARATPVSGHTPAMQKESISSHVMHFLHVLSMPIPPFRLSFLLSAHNRVSRKLLI